MVWLGCGHAGLLVGACRRAIAASVNDLLRAYPDELAGFDGTNLIWRDGTRMPVDDGRHDKSLEEQLRHGSILDQLRLRYPAGAPLLPPPPDDPGRVRNRAFFDKMYGDCKLGRWPRTWCPWSGCRRPGDTSSESPASTVSIGSWQRSRANWMNCRRRISDTFTRLAEPTRAGRSPIPGRQACTPGARRSISTRGSRITGCGGDRRADVPAYVDRIPADIVAVFERHGFIWGGRWAHFDTMHFEYRPELLPSGE